jgi:hypothetical protein
MNWTPLTRQALDEIIANGLEVMDDAVQVAWQAIRIEPEKWQCSPWGDEGGGFWVVAEKDSQVIWYNDIEGGFNTSPFARRGTIREYACNQTTFEEFLLGLPAARGVESWRDDTMASIVPLVLQRGGAIVHRQTTYWELRSTDGSFWRLHFKSKTETRFVESQFSKMEIVDVHPILDQYQEPWGELFFSGASINPTEMIGMLAERVKTATHGWRTIEEYLNKGVDLRKDDDGLLMRAPASIVNIANVVLSERGISTSVLNRSGHQTRLHAVIMDKNLVVAEGFRFEARNTT